MQMTNVFSINLFFDILSYDCVDNDLFINLNLCLCGELNHTFLGF